MSGAQRGRFFFAGCLLIILAGWLCYANILNGAFVLDDESLIINNSQLHRLDWRAILTSDILAGEGKRSAFYRPAQIFSYVMDKGVWGMRPFGFHVTSILWHIAAGICVFIFAAKILGRDEPALLAGLLFVTHPVHTEAVSYIAGRSDPMAFVFMMGSFFLYWRLLDRPSWMTGGGMMVCYAFALLSRETAMILPVLVLVYHGVFRRPLRAGSDARGSVSSSEGMVVSEPTGSQECRAGDPAAGQPAVAVRIKGRVACAPFFCLLCVWAGYVFARSVLLRPLLKLDDVSRPFADRMPGVFAALGQYLRILFFPVGLHMEYGQRIFVWTDPLVVAGILCVAAMGIVLAWQGRRDHRIAFAVLWFLLALIPVLNIFPINAYMAEHWIYLPSVGFFLLCAAAWEKWWLSRRLRRWLVAVTIMCVGMEIVLTVKQNSYWRDPEFFYKRTLVYAPDSALMLNNLGIIYKKTGRVTESIALFERAIRVKPDHRDAFYNLANACAKEGDDSRAEAAYKRAIELDPDYFNAYNNLGLLYLRQGRMEDALRQYDRTLKRWPFYLDAGINLSTVLIQSQRYEDAARLLRDIVQAYPESARARANLAYVLYKTGSIEEARRHADAARALGDPTELLKGR